MYNISETCLLTIILQYVQTITIITTALGFVYHVTSGSAPDWTDDQSCAVVGGWSVYIF